MTSPRALATPTYAQMLETVGATGIVMRATGGAIPELLLMEEIRQQHLVGCMYKLPVNNEINCQPQLVNAGFLPSTVSMVFLVTKTKPARFRKSHKKKWSFLAKFLGFRGRWCEKNNSCENLEKMTSRSSNWMGFACWDVGSSQTEQIPPDV